MLAGDVWHMFFIRYQNLPKMQILQFSKKYPKSTKVEKVTEIVLFYSSRVPFS